MWRNATKLEMLRKITSSARGLKPSISILKGVNHLYGKSSVIRHDCFGRNDEVMIRHYGSAAAAAAKGTSSEEKEKYDAAAAAAKGTSEEKEKYDALRERQLKLETEAWSNALKEYQELVAVMCEKKLTPNLPYMKKLFLGWFEPLKDAISAQQDSCRKVWKYCKGDGYVDYAPYFVQLPADIMAVITMHKLMALLMMNHAHGFLTVMQASTEIGEAIEHEVKVHRFLEKSHVEGAATKEQRQLGKDVAKLMEKQKGRQIRVIVNKHDDSKPWGLHNQVKVGARLIQLLMETAYIQPPVDQPFDASPDIRLAFTHTIKYVGDGERSGMKRIGVIQCDPLVRKGLEESGRYSVIPYMPMVVPPMNWTGYDKGAYLFLPSYIIRTQGKQQRVAIKRVPKDQLQTVFEALNTLGNTKWRINNKVLSIIDRIWASGGGGCLACLVDREDIPIPEKPDTDDASENRKWKWKVRDVKKENAIRHAQRCDVVLKLAVARKMKDEEGFYFPHNMDFRGRAYPMHSHLNHLGSDLCRGILEFAEGRPLGASGLRWLKIQMANLYAGGVDKLSYEDRIAFTENHLHDIFDSADRPVEGRRWWLKAEDPFQCLAACMDLTEALRSSSPEDYVSYMPVHQDGSCNGLQHYAALGRDKLGAKAVNLVAGDKPADVYSDIAKRVSEIMGRDAEKVPSIEPNAPHAKLLLDQVDRKLVKQTVMTSVYGVTYRGARDQIKKRLMEREIADDSELFAAAVGYAAKVTMTAQSEMFQEARSIMSWLSDCAKIIASENQPVQWTTPVGLPVVQHYRKLGLQRVKTSLQLLTLRHETDEIMAKQQRTAFPPNFVHSLDASHMMMTAIACKRLGLTFAGVHDSYWTHACDVDEMNRILREKFVELYEQPILENLLESFQTSFPKLEFPPLPERGDFDLRDVLESQYFFN